MLLITVYHIEINQKKQMLPGPVIIFTRLHILPYAVLLRNAAGISIEQKQLLCYTQFHE